MESRNAVVVGLGKVAQRATWMAVAVLAAGLLLMLLYSAAEAIANPGSSLVDGYWRGALPWMGIIEGLVVGGATACAVAGTAAVAILGGWARRALVLVPVAVAGLWWFMASMSAGMSGAACAGCSPPPLDPWAYAYSAPLLALQMLIVPAAAVAFLALGRRTAA